MPVVLEDSQFDDWMRGTPDQAAMLMKPYAGAIEAWEVGAEVGNVKNNRPELIERVGLL
jgi:putative SOS response-associated peptidase YedK